MPQYWFVFFKKIGAVFLLLAASIAFGKSAVSLDFVDTPIDEVVRAVSLAYDTPILVDGNLRQRVTFHLDGVELLEGLSALCSANGLELVQFGAVFHVRRLEERGEHEFRRGDSLISISVRDKDIADFVQEFGANTGLNVLTMQGTEGKVSGSLRDVAPEDALRFLMKANGFRAVKSGNVFCIEADVAKRKNSSLEGVAVRGAVSVWQDGDSYGIAANEVPLSEVLLELSRVSGLDLALYGDVRESVRISMENASLEKLLNALFKGRNFGYALDGQTLFVAESGSRNALAVTKLYLLKHVHSERALAYLQKLPPNANFVAAEVKEQNALLLSGSNAEIQVAEDLLKLVDVPPLQVTLSCIIVEFKRGNNFEIGLHSGASRKTGEKDVGLRGFMDFSNARLTKSGALGKVGILPDRFEIELAAMEQDNRAEVLARPRLTTINGNKAELNVTNTVYYLVSQVSADGFPITDYRSFNDGISLEITPSVTQDGSITLEVSPEIKTAGRSTGDGPRDISTRNLKTVVVMRDGETFCLGGLIRKNKSEVRSAVPFLGSLPIIGRIFSYVSEEEEDNELVVFITPQVKNEWQGVPSP